MARTKKLIAFTTVGIIALWGVSFFVINENWPDQRAEIGEMFGAIDSLFAGLALAGVIITIYLQQKSNEVQSFDNTFFQILSFYNQIISEMQIVNKANTSFKGRSAFFEFHERFKSKYQSEPLVLDQNLNHKEIWKFTQMKFNEYFLENQEYLGHYYRTIYEILKIIERSQIKDKQKYADILIAQLSSFELVFIYYEVLTLYNSDFNQLVKKYNLLRHLPLKKIKEIDEKHELIFKPKLFFNKDENDGIDNILNVISEKKRKQIETKR